MAVIHISEAEAVRDIAEILIKVKNGEQVHIDDGDRTITVMKISSQPLAFPAFSEVVRLAHERNSQTQLDDQFGDDVEAIMRTHREEPRRDLWEE